MGKRDSETPALCRTCMRTVDQTAKTLRDQDSALNLCFSNGLLRETGEELVSIAEQQENIADDRDEIAWLQGENARLRAQVKRLETVIDRADAERHDRKRKIVLG